MSTTWLADGPIEIMPALSAIGVGGYRHVYCHADKTSADPDFTGLVVVNDERHHASFWWPHQAAITEALAMADDYAAVITGVAERYPKASIGIYGLPNPATWLAEGGEVMHWGMASQATRDACTEWYLESLLPIAPVVDTIVVSCYEPLETTSIVPHAAAWAASIGMARAVSDHWLQLGSSAKPAKVAAFVSPFVMKGNPKSLPDTRWWLDRTVKHVVASKPDTIVCWGAWGYWIEVAIAPPPSMLDQAATLHARSLMASVLATFSLAAPQPTDDGAWASIEPLLRRAANAAVYGRIEAAVFESDRVSQDTSKWRPSTDALSVAA